jgi:hypothetical protein
MKELGVWEPLMVKTQTFKTAIEAGEAVTAVGSEARSVCGGGGGVELDVEAAGCVGASDCQDTDVRDSDCSS